MSGEQGSATSKVQIERELRQMNDEWVKALVRRDGATLERIMSEDFIFTYPLDGDDRAQFISDVTSGELLVEYLNRDNVRVRIWGQTAILTGRDSVKWVYKGRELEGHYKLINVYSCRNDRWELVALQACPMS